MNKFFASCPVGLEQVLSNELKSLGIQKLQHQRGGIDFEADELSAIKAILLCRVASRVYKKLWNFKAETEKDLYETSIKLDWQSVMELRQSFKIRSIFEHGAKSTGRFRNSMYSSQILKDAIADNFRNKMGERPSVDKDDPDLDLVLRLQSGNASILLNLCGAPLNQRGYRTESTEATIKENLAYGIIALTGWAPSKEPFIDSMCGSGTFCTEAVMIKTGIPAGYLRIKQFLEKQEKPWAFLRHLYFSTNKELKKDFESYCKTVLLNAESNIKSKLPENPDIFGFDIDSDAIRIAKTNMESIGLLNLAVIKKANAVKLSPPVSSRKGIILCNPPYGERLGLTQELKGMYLDYGSNLKRNFKGWKAYVFTGNEQLAKLIPLKPDSSIKLFNGDIECRLMAYSLR